jgi:uncharacterized protein (DUF4415 family)
MHERAYILNMIQSSTRHGTNIDKGPRAGQPGKTRITIRLDNEILEWFRDRVQAQGGGSYQGMINGALRDYIRQGGEGLEELLRRVIREELGSKSPADALFSLPAGKL